MGHHQAARPHQGCLVYRCVIIDIYSRYNPVLDRLSPRKRRTGRSIHRRGHRLQLRHPSLRPRRPRHVHDPGAGLGTAHQPRRHQITFPATGSNDNPFSEAQLKPSNTSTISRNPLHTRQMQAIPGRILQRVQPHPPPLRYRPAHPRLGPLRHLCRRRRCPPHRPDRRLPGQPSPVQPPTHPTENADHRLHKRTRTRTPSQLIRTVSFDLTDSGKARASER